MRRLEIPQHNGKVVHAQPVARGTIDERGRIVIEGRMQKFMSAADHLATALDTNGELLSDAQKADLTTVIRETADRCITVLETGSRVAYRLPA
jgi:hypothetical protein